MKRTFEHPDGRRWQVSCLDDEVMVQSGDEVVVHDAWSSHQVPPEVLFDRLIGAQLAMGFVEQQPDDLLAQIETAQELTLTGRARAFYASGEWKRYEGKRCQRIDRVVSFMSNYSIGYFGQEFWDRETQAMIELWPLCSITNDDGYEDEQAWIGLDPRLPDGPIYRLYTSNAYEPFFDSLDAFLADLV